MTGDGSVVVERIRPRAETAVIEHAAVVVHTAVAEGVVLVIDVPLEPRVFDIRNDVPTVEGIAGTDAIVAGRMPDVSRKMLVYRVIEEIGGVVEGPVRTPVAKHPVILADARQRPLRAAMKQLIVPGIVPLYGQLRRRQNGGGAAILVVPTPVSQVIAQQRDPGDTEKNENFHDCLPSLG